MKRAAWLRVSLIVILLCALATPFEAMAQFGSRPASGTAKPVDSKKPVPGKFTHPKLKGWINDIPDTGQFLPDSVWLLRVGPRVTTVGSYLRSWFASYPEYRPTQDSAGRVQFLKTLMNRDILGLTALSQDRTLGFEDRLALRETRQRSLATAVYQRFVHDSVKVVEEDEIKTVWETYKWKQHFRHILVPEKSIAERVRRDLVSGHIAWVAAAKKYSVSTNDKGPDGELGWVQRDKIAPPIARRIFGLKPGETSLPVQDREGWHLVQSVERQPVDPPEYRAMRNTLRSQLLDERAGEYSERLLAHLRLQVGMRYDTVNVLFASKRFGETMKVNQEAMQTSFVIDGTVPEFASEDTSRALATWKGGRFSIGALLHAFEDIPPVLRPSLNSGENLVGFVEATVLEPSIAEYGAQKGLENDPLVKEPMDMKREELFVGHLYQDSIGSRVWVSKDERRAYYKKNLNQFFTYASVEYAAILRNSKAGADSVERALRSGTKAAALLAADSAAGRTSGTIQTRNQNEQGPYHKALFEELRPGGIQVRGPDRQGDYVVIQLLDYDGGRQLSYEESETMIDESLQNAKSDAALQAMIARLKSRYDVAWRPELVNLIKLVDPTLEQN
jgi:PPIC-type peptidyl-prolyl cis-trans isomerase-like protein